MLKVIAFGGSAGAFEAFRTQILPRLPVSDDASYVFITHLPRTHISSIPSLFQRHTKLDVHCSDQVQTVEAGCLYVLAPHTFLYLRGDTLVPEPRPPHSPNRAVNHFFISLADARGPSALAVVLSGAGSDGKEGCTKLRARGGRILVQDPATCLFAGMPRAVIQTGAADEVLAPAAVPAEIARWIDRPDISAPPARHAS